MGVNREGWTTAVEEKGSKVLMSRPTLHPTSFHDDVSAMFRLGLALKLLEVTFMYPSNVNV